MGKYPLFISLALVLSACQIYRNNSRELFEKNAPSRIVNSDIGSKSIHIHHCWTQEETSELPPLENTVRYFYTTQNNLDEPTIEVCLAETIDPHHDSDRE